MFNKQRFERDVEGNGAACFEGKGRRVGKRV
jgi:hypothetical protein